MQKILNLVAQRASEIVQNLLKITESQFKQMSKPLARTAPIHRLVRQLLKIDLDDLKNAPRESS